MIDKEIWNIRIDRDKMESLIKYNMAVQYKMGSFYFSYYKESIVFFYEW